MYNDFFGFREPPFSIAPDPRYLYLSDRHKEALAHLMYGVQGQGGFIVITGEVGTGKTTVSRCFIENAPEHVDIALVLNPRLSARELLSSICDELEIGHPERASIKHLVGLINDDLLEAHAGGRHKVLMIDEAQNLSADVLEQLRLLTNLETTEKKLLQIVLLGQPELQDMLALPQLRQLNQRVTARYHLEGLGRQELDAYIRYRLGVAGLRGEIFSESAVRALYRYSQGIPRLINLICDRALLGAYAQSEHHITAGHIRKAAREVTGQTKKQSGWLSGKVAPVALIACVAALAALIGIVGLVGDKEDSVVSDETSEITTIGNAGFVGTVERLSDRTKPPEPLELPQPELADFKFEQRLTSLAGAFSALFDRWGREYEPASAPIACDFAQSQGLQCLESRMSRQGLMFLNRPAILYLRNSAGEAGYVVLNSLDGESATIASADGQQVVSFDSVETHWHGRFTVLWETPPFEDQQVWLSARLMELASQQAVDRSEESRVVRLTSEEQIRWYQSKKGLTVDGIAGAMTIIQMNNDLNAAVPRLNAQGGAG